MRLGPDAVTPVVLTALQTGAVFARADVGVLSLAGPGAVASMQGLLTNDVEKPGDGAFIYGALLTPKGMIVVDGWAARQGTTVTYTVPVVGREAALAIFTRSIPPRLARTSDLTADLAVFRLAGPQALAKIQSAGVAVPPGPGRMMPVTLGAAACDVARASDQAPFVLQVTAPSADAAAVAERLAAAGILHAEPVALDCARGFWRGGRASAPKWTRRPSRRRSGSKSWAACPSPRAATRGRRRSPVCIFGDT